MLLFKRLFKFEISKAETIYKSCELIYRHSVKFPISKQEKGEFLLPSWIIFAFVNLIG